MLGETSALLQCEEGCRSCHAAEGSQESERDSTSGDPTSLCACTWASSLREWASGRASEFQTQTSQLFSWASKEVQPYLELVWKCCIFYLDLALDVQAIVFFISSHEFEFGLVNLLGILLSNVYTFIDMRQAVETAGAQASEALTAGYLVPFNLHYLYLTGVTWASWRREAGGRYTVLAKRARKSCEGAKYITQNIIRPFIDPPIRTVHTCMHPSTSRASIHSSVHPSTQPLDF